MILFLVIGCAFISIIVTAIIVLRYIVNKARIELDIDDSLAEQDSATLSLTHCIRNTGSKPTSVSNPYLIIFGRENVKIEIHPENQVEQKFFPTIESFLPDSDGRHIHPGQLLQKRVYFILPKEHKHKTICCQLSARYGKNQVASSSLLRINLNDGMIKKLTSFVN